MLQMLLSTWKIALEKNPPAQQPKTGNLPQVIGSTLTVSTANTTTTTIGTQVKDSGYTSSQLHPQSSASTTSTNSSMSGLNVPSSGSSAASHHGEARKPEISISTTLHLVEGFTLVMLCNYRPSPRKQAVHILKEVKMIMKYLGLPEVEPPLIDVIDKCCPQVRYFKIFFLPTYLYILLLRKFFLSPKGPRQNSVHVASERENSYFECKCN